MTRLQQKPILHGRDHCPGGPDPIPCWPGGLSPGTFEETVRAIDDLYAYWRLGETGTPWLDTSGVGTAENLAEQLSGTALTPDVTGALTTGDDGALEFNYDGTSPTGGRYLTTGGSHKDFAGISADMTVAAWVNVKASAATRRGHIIGNSAVAGDNSMLGWGFHVMYPGQEIRFTRGQAGAASSELYTQTAGGVVAGDWNLFVGTYDGTTNKLYADGALIDTTADATGPHGTDTILRVGGSYTHYSGGAVFSWLYGTVDEAAIWTRALTSSEVADLYASGVGAFEDGWILTMVGGVPTWAAPTIEVSY